MAYGRGDTQAGIGEKASFHERLPKEGVCCRQSGDKGVVRTGLMGSLASSLLELVVVASCRWCWKQT